VDTANSQKKSPRSSARSEKSTTSVVDAPIQGRRPPAVEDEGYMDRSIDLVARVRAAKEAAQREMESFGDPSEYEVTMIYGQSKEEPTEAVPPPVAFAIADKPEAD
jgi:hypothetical protein